MGSDGASPASVNFTPLSPSRSWTAPRPCTRRRCRSSTARPGARGTSPCSAASAWPLRCRRAASAKETRWGLRPALLPLASPAFFASCLKKHSSHCVYLRVCLSLTLCLSGVWLCASAHGFVSDCIPTLFYFCPDCGCSLAGGSDCPERPEMYEAHFGIPMTGASSTPSTRAWTPAQWQSSCRHGEAQALLVHVDFLPLARDALQLLKDQVRALGPTTLLASPTPFLFLSPPSLSPPPLSLSHQPLSP